MCNIPAVLPAIWCVFEVTVRYVFQNMKVDSTKAVMEERQDNSERGKQATIKKYETEIALIINSVFGELIGGDTMTPTSRYW